MNNTTTMNDAAALLFVNDVVLPLPREETPQVRSFILPLGEGEPILRITYCYDAHPTKRDWYIIDIAIIGLTNKHQCYEVLLYAGEEPYYDEEADCCFERRQFWVKSDSVSQPMYPDIFCRALETITAQILKK